METFETKVYFARAARTGHVKIGASYQVKNRLKLLAAAIKSPVELLVTTPGARPLETSFHLLFWDLHVGHEWFEASPRIDAAVIALREGWLDFSKLPVGRSPIISAAMKRARAARMLAQADAA